MCVCVIGYGQCLSVLFCCISMAPGRLMFFGHFAFAVEYWERECPMHLAHLVSGELLPVTSRDWAAQFRWSLIMLSSWVSLIEQLATKPFEVRCQLLAPQLAPASLPELSGTDQMITIFGQAWSFWWYPLCIGVNFENYFEVEPFSSWLNYGPLASIKKKIIQKASLYCLSTYLPCSRISFYSEMLKT